MTCTCFYFIVPELIGLEPQLYGGRDPHIPSQRIPEEEIDVAAIARSVPSQTGEDRLLMANLRRLLMIGKESESMRASNSHDTTLSKRQHLRQLSPAIVPGEGWASESLSYSCTHN